MGTADRDRRVRGGIAALAVLVCAFALAGTARADTQPPWEAAEHVRPAPLEAQTAPAPEEPPPRSVGAARRAFQRSLAPEIAAADPAAARSARAALRRADAAFRAGDEASLAAARGEVVAAIRRGAYAVTMTATRDDDVATARRWL